MVAILSQQVSHFGHIMKVQPKTYHFTEVALNCNKHFVSLGEDRNVTVLTTVVS